jgi:two-component system chemotaxis sensor kinase CheA
MNLAGELVLSRNQLRAAIAQNNFQSLSVADQRLNQVTSELQDAIMRTRLQPIGNVFAKFPRVVRDMANALHKEIQLDIRGKDVALDRSLIEGLSDPLTHMVRNAVDHGVETPEERARAGKKSLGTVRIEAMHEAGQVVVEIADDGKGIDPRRVADSALAKGLITAEKLRSMSDHDKVALIFLPGLSTADQVTDISGRGVGMDVVKTNLDRLGGKVEIKSEIGKGTLFRIKLPLTLAIIPSLIVSVEGERFAIPQINVEELLRIRAEDLKRRIEVVGGAEVLLLRDRIIPLVRFGNLLGVMPTYVDPATGTREIDRRTNLADRRSPHHSIGTPSPPAGEGGGEGASATDRKRADGRRHSESGALEIAVVTTGTMQYGLVVGSFHNTEEIVVKPLGRHLKGHREYAGATILGDGTVALILDVAGMAAKAELSSVSGSARALEQAKEAEREKLEDTHSLLLFHNAPDELCAAPLDIVLRVERVTPTQVEMAGSRRTMQYRGASLPLVTLSDAARVKPIGETKDLAVIVSNVHGREVGLLGAMPVDVIETKAAIDQVTHRQKGIAGSAIIRDRTTLISDVFELVDTVYPEWGKEKEAVRSGGMGTAKGTLSVLLAEDSGFFRAQVKRYLEEDGYNVFEAPDGEAAWELLIQHVDEVRAVVTDIEMPRLTGLGLAERIRGDGRTAKLPVIALTSLASEEDMAKGKAAGVNDYQVKLDRDRLLESVRLSLAGSLERSAATG